MKAVRFYGPGKYQVEDIQKPQISSTDILVKVEACGLCGSDIRTLEFGHRRVSPPFTIGHEVAGKVIELGSKANCKIKLGDQVAIAPVVYCATCSYCKEGRFEYCEEYQEFGQTWPGGFAEYMLIPQDALQNGVIHPIPAGLDPVWATLAEPLGACLHALDRMDLEIVKSAAIFGAGTIGCMMLQLLRGHDVEKIAVVDPNQNRLETAQKLGANFAINNHETDLPKDLRKMSGKEGVDLAITATAAPSALTQAMGIMNKGGQIIVFAGLPKDQSRFDFDMNEIHYRCLTISGSSIYAPRHHHQALKMIADSTVIVDDLITTIPLEDFNRGAKLAIEGKVIKAVFIP